MKKIFKLILTSLLLTGCQISIDINMGKNSSKIESSSKESNISSTNNNSTIISSSNSSNNDLINSNEKEDNFNSNVDELIEEIIRKNGGVPEFDEEVEINVWSIVGDPDRAVQERLFDKFNDDYFGQIKINYTYVGHFDFYNCLETTWAVDRESIPDVLFMHNEKTVQYAAQEYLWPLDSFIGENVTGVDFDFTQVYENIDRVTKWNNRRYAIPVDAHGFLTSFRQDIIKKNGLGFDNNTRFIPESRAEYQTLLEGLRSKADKGELWIRDISKRKDHTWKKADKNYFAPSFMQSTDPDGLSALYANGGTLVSEDQSTITFHQNKGFETYLTDQVDRYNNKLIQDGYSTGLFAEGNVVMFSEGPWYVSQVYNDMYNNSDLKRAGQLGVTQEDADDPVYSAPYVASRPLDWWTLDENMGSETAGKWYGNGYAFSITRVCDDLNKIAAALTFMDWYINGVDSYDDSKHNLTTWCSTGHIPAWKHIYESNDYKEELANNMSLRALGNPEDIIAMEGLIHETTIFNGLSSVCCEVQTLLRQGNCTKEKATKKMNDMASSYQDILDILNMEF